MVAVVDEDALVPRGVARREQAPHAREHLGILTREQLELGAGEVPRAPRMIGIGERLPNPLHLRLLDDHLRVAEEVVVRRVITEMGVR